ncbi:MAG: SDR family NAD(P)-dependent oxidoreductase [Betaproteobacteria bacterium]|nr:SDR family NAD(P)-dependent oxidoreductase [Betaproteobacteria bacterium]
MEISHACLTRKMSTRRQNYALTKKQLEGRTALVTGASQGIGRAIALAFARNGANIVVTARSEDKLRALAAEAEAMGVRALAAPADLGVESEINAAAGAAIAKFGGVDIGQQCRHHPPAHPGRRIRPAAFP